MKYRGILTVCLTVVLAISLTACNGSNNPGKEGVEIDNAEMSYPAEICGSWSLIKASFYGSSDVGEVDIGFSVSEDAWQEEDNILFFDVSGGFQSGVSLVTEQLFIGEASNMTQYNGWKYIQESESNSTFGGYIEFTPAVTGYTYSVSLAEDNTMTLVITELYIVESRTTPEGLVTKGGEIQMTYTLTLVRTPEQ